MKFSRTKEKNWKNGKIENEWKSSISLKSLSIFSPGGETREKRARESLIVFATRCSLRSSHVTHYSTRRRAPKCKRFLPRKKKKEREKKRFESTRRDEELEENSHTRDGRKIRLGNRVLRCFQRISRRPERNTVPRETSSEISAEREIVKLRSPLTDENSPGLGCFRRKLNTGAKKRKETSKVKHVRSKLPRLGPPCGC